MKKLHSFNDTGKGVDLLKHRYIFRMYLLYSHDCIFIRMGQEMVLYYHAYIEMFVHLNHVIRCYIQGCRRCNWFHCRL